MTHKRALLVATFAFFAACSDSGPGGSSGTVSFDYTGVISGNFNASGSMPLFMNTDRSWAVGIRDDTQGALAIAGILPSTSPKYHFATISIPRLTPGTETIDVANCTSNCAALIVAFGNDDTAGSTDYFCGLETGTVVISSITEGRATGTFSGTGSCSDSVGTQTQFAITNGTFNVPVRSGSGL